MRIDDITPYAKDAVNKIEWLETTFAPYPVSTDMFHGISNYGRYGVKFGANLSSEHTKLIKLAARFCERFASDILIDFEMVDEWLNKTDMDSETEEKIFFFGFRRDGVDHEAYIKSKCENTEGYLARLMVQAEYHSLYAWYFRKENDGYFYSVLFEINI